MMLLIEFEIKTEYPNENLTKQLVKKLGGPLPQYAVNVQNKEVFVKILTDIYTEHKHLNDLKKILKNKTAITLLFCRYSPKTMKINEFIQEIKHWTILGECDTINSTEMQLTDAKQKVCLSLHKPI